MDVAEALLSGRVEGGGDDSGLFRVALFVRFKGGGEEASVLDACRLNEASSALGEELVGLIRGEVVPLIERTR